MAESGEKLIIRRPLKTLRRIFLYISVFVQPVLYIGRPTRKGPSEIWKTQLLGVLYVHFSLKCYFAIGITDRRPRREFNGLSNRRDRAVCRRFIHYLYDFAAVKRRAGSLKISS